MKKSELKTILKPLIKECVKEVILDEGILSGLISEVARGVSSIQAAPVQTEVAQKKEDPAFDRMRHNAFTQQESGKLKEHKMKLMEAIGSSAYNGVDLFEGTTPAPGQQTVAQMANTAAAGPPGDSGVDIGGLLGSVGSVWNAHMNELKERK